MYKIDDAIQNKSCNVQHNTIERARTGNDRDNMKRTVPDAPRMAAMLRISYAIDLITYSIAKIAHVEGLQQTYKALLWGRGTYTQTKLRKYGEQLLKRQVWSGFIQRRATPDMLRCESC